MTNMMPMTATGSPSMQGRAASGKGQTAGDFLPFLQQAQGEGLAFEGTDSSQDLLAALLAASLGGAPSTLPAEGLALPDFQGGFSRGDGLKLTGQDLLAMNGSQQNPAAFFAEEGKMTDAAGQAVGRQALMSGAEMLDSEAALEVKLTLAKGESSQTNGNEGKGSLPLSDSRFAEILGVKPVEVKNEGAMPNKEATGNPSLRLTQNGQMEEALEEPALTVEVAADEAGEVPELSLGHKGSLAGEVDGFSHKGQDALLVDTGRPSQAPAAGLEGKGPEVRLNSGMLISENRIVEQTIEKFAVHNPREAGSITLRLHPEELGQVKVELVMDKDSVRAHLHAQSQQVQEVLERHLPRLRDALEQQGLKIDQLQVSVDSQHNGNREAFQQHAQSGFAGFQAKPGPLTGYKETPAVAPSTQTSAQQGSGLSLRI